jgi:hypothetical protein
MEEIDGVVKDAIKSDQGTLGPITPTRQES